jgi:peptide/nickel transport system substrate-binding protein
MSKHLKESESGLSTVLGQISRREFVKQALVLGGAASAGIPFLSSCAPGPAGAPATATPSASEEKVITYATSGFPPGVDSDSQIALPSIEVQWNIYDNLMHWRRVKTEEGHSVPEWNTDTWIHWMLEDYSTSDDGTEWTLKLKEGIMSHSGNEFKAADIVYMWDRHFDLGILGPFWATVARVEGKDSYEAVDDRTFRIRTKTPSPGMLYMLENLLALHPWDSAAAQEHATEDDPYATEWIKRNGSEAGHGPYVIEEWNTGDSVVLRAFDEYHRGRPAVDKVVYKFVESSATRLSLLKQGAVDIARDLLPSELEEAESTPGLEVTSWTGARSRILMLIPNLSAREEFQDPRVRQALAYAAPYGEIVDGIYRGYASRWKGCIPQDFPLFTDEFWPYGDGQDFDKARQLLEEAGYGSGLEFTLLYNASLPEMEDIAVILRSTYDKVGVEFELEKLADAAFTQNYTSSEFEVLLLDDLTLTPDIGYSTYLWFQSDSPQNVGKYSNPEVDELSETILSTLDKDEREAAGREIQKVILEDAPHVYLCQPHFSVAKREGIVGETNTSARVLRFDDLDVIS